MTTPRARRLLLLALIVLPCIGCDQATKQLARTHLVPGQTIEHLGGTVVFILTHNSGAFLSTGSRLPGDLRQGLLVGGVALALAILTVVLLATRSLSTTSFVLGALVLAGGLGNLIDRIAFHGQVTDFLLLRAGPLHTGIFNLADVLITTAAVGFLVRGLIPRRPSPEAPA